MKDELFNELIESAKEAVEISKGHQIAARITTYELPDVKSIRDNTGLTQKQFALAVGVSPSLLEAWEQHNRVPKGSSLKVLRLLERDPSIFSVIQSL
ncbi:putative transcriptional regulator [Candidatus Regiella insecticola 5.15]|uniref:Putative transcriptional regulator n=1 Tax=Candidatus Regiella insecticola 5.15 TaxID=1005043 RepID=G2GX65_9ENTR|nr:NadS family protein [Candidatus Regiella insecticola]EGY29663.1 putative transcriptional regulator [Candidatus Regiella insecticola 5.15]